MARKRGQKGVWNIDRPGRPHPYGVQWRERDGDRRRTRTEFFDTTSARDARAATLRKDKRTGSLITATRAEIDDWRAFQAAVDRAPWQDVVAGWKSYLLQNGLEPCKLTVAEAARDYLKSCERRTVLKQMSVDTLRHKRRIIERFAEHFGTFKLPEVAAGAVEKWIETCPEVRACCTFNSYRKQVRAMFEPHVTSGLLRRNPVADIKNRADKGDEVAILSVPAAARLFAFALESERFRVCLGRLALEAFVGLRFSSGCRLEKADIKFADRGILLPAHKLKTGKRHYIDGLPDQVWEWLKITPDACWQLTKRQYLELKTRLFLAAGVPHPHNCLRHSFCTYDVAAHKNPGRTAVILCHRNQQLLWEHYNGVAAEVDGKLYQSITPQTATKLALAFVPQGVSAPHAA